jgi:hypothetical protein
MLFSPIDQSVEGTFMYFKPGIALQNKSFKIGIYLIAGNNLWLWKGFIESYFKIIILSKNGGSLQNYFLKYKMAKLIGLTGGIGSGKLQLLIFFAEFGVLFMLQTMKQKTDG